MAHIDGFFRMRWATVHDGTRLIPKRFSSRNTNIRENEKWNSIGRILRERLWKGYSSSMYILTVTSLKEYSNTLIRTENRLNCFTTMINHYSFPYVQNLKELSFCKYTVVTQYFANQHFIVSHKLSKQDQLNL